MFNALGTASDYATRSTIRMMALTTVSALLTTAGSACLRSRSAARSAGVRSPRTSCCNNGASPADVGGGSNVRVASDAGLFGGEVSFMGK